jgi:hypothetical protein
MTHRPVALGLLVANVALASGCIPPENLGHESTPPPVPEATMPDVAMPAPVPGTTSVVLDAVDGSADVKLVHAHTEAALPEPMGDGRALCATPCALNLPPGRYQLSFSRRHGSSSDGVVSLNVREEPILYRRELGTGWGGSKPLMIGGYVAYSIGGWAFWISLIGTAADEHRDASDWTFVASSAAVSLLGLLLMDIGACDHRPGSDGIFKLPL